MSPTIIIDFHDTRGGRDALALAQSLGELTGARFVAVTAHQLDRYGMLPAQVWPAAMPEETTAAAELARSLLADEPRSIARVIRAPSIARALHESAEREQADLIVLGAERGGENGHGAVGATARQILQGAPCAVALAPAGFADKGWDLAPVGVGFDGSPESRVAVASAAGIAESVGAELRVIAALRNPAAAHPMFAVTSYRRHLEQLHEDVRSGLIEAVAALSAYPEIDPLVMEGEPAEALADASHELGLLVIGSRGYGPVRRVLLGSVSGGLLERTACPVLIVPRGVERAYGAPLLHTRPARSH